MLTDRSAAGDCALQRLADVCYRHRRARSVANWHLPTAKPYANGQRMVSAMLHENSGFIHGECEQHSLQLMTWNFATGLKSKAVLCYLRFRSYEPGLARMNPMLDFAAATSSRPQKQRSWPKAIQRCFTLSSNLCTLGHMCTPA